LQILSYFFYLLHIK